MILSQFQAVGHDLFRSGLVSSHSGNLSIRLGDRVIITRRGSRLGCLQESDLIDTGLYKNDRATPLASTELAVHRAIYHKTQARAVIHAHPPHAIVLSLTETEIIPPDIEGLGIESRVPVEGWNMEVKLGGLCDIIAQALTQHKVILVHGHGSFAVGELLEEAHRCTTTLEESCHITFLLRLLKSTPGAKIG